MWSRPRSIRRRRNWRSSTVGTPGCCEKMRRIASHFHFLRRETRKNSAAQAALDLAILNGPRRWTSGRCALSRAAGPARWSWQRSTPPPRRSTARRACPAQRPARVRPALRQSPSVRASAPGAGRRLRLIMIVAMRISMVMCAVVSILMRMIIFVPVNRQRTPCARPEQAAVFRGRGDMSGHALTADMTIQANHPVRGAHHHMRIVQQGPGQQHRLQLPRSRQRGQRLIGADSMRQVKKPALSLARSGRYEVLAAHSRCAGPACG